MSCRSYTIGLMSLHPKNFVLSQQDQKHLISQKVTNIVLRNVSIKKDLYQGLLGLGLYFCS